MVVDCSFRDFSCILYVFAQLQRPFDYRESNSNTNILNCNCGAIWRLSPLVLLNARRWLVTAKKLVKIFLVVLLQQIRFSRFYFTCSTDIFFEMFCLYCLFPSCHKQFLLISHHIELQCFNDLGQGVKSVLVSWRFEAIHGL